MSEFMQQALVSMGEFVTNIADVLGTTAIHIYKVMVLQQILEGAMAAFGLVGIILGSYWIAKTVDKRMAKAFKKDYMVEDKLLVWGFTLFVSFTLFTRVIPVITAGVTKMANPEYYVLERLWSEGREVLK